MLKRLRVADLALVAGAEVRFGPGLNLLTGETGSGKSLLVDALGLCLGSRASSEQVRHGADRARIEAEFDGLTLAREIGRRSSAVIDGRPATVEQLRALAGALVQVHGQHEHQGLLDAEAQTLLLDTYGGALEAASRTGEAHRAWSEAVARLRELERLQARGRREEEYVRWQMEELRAAGLRPGEDEELAQERAVARHSARLAELTAAGLEALREDQALPVALARVRAAAELDPRLGAPRARLEAVAEEVSDLGAELRAYGEGLDTDPTRLEALEGRLAELEGIKRKYGGSLVAAIEERDRLERQLGETADLDASLAAAAAGVEARRESLAAASTELSELRHRAARRLGEEVSSELANLRLEGACFEVRLIPREVVAEGAELAEMLFSGNPGEPPGALARVASGGELARVMLAIKTVGAAADRLPTLVFDEVDTGIGGETALQVGLRLRALGRARQVLVVTHLAQIACFADHHLLVEKTRGPGGRNLVTVRELATDADRAAELARMMSGGVTEKARARAHELLDEARARRPAPT
ncbi:MAG: DNA repair protein RecN [Candidatus Dormibacteraceae bacterium]